MTPKQEIDLVLEALSLVAGRFSAREIDLDRLSAIDEALPLVSQRRILDVLATNRSAARARLRGEPHIEKKFDDP